MVLPRRWPYDGAGPKYTALTDSLLGAKHVVDDLTDKVGYREQEIRQECKSFQKAMIDDLLVKAEYDSDTWHEMDAYFKSIPYR